MSSIKEPFTKRILVKANRVAKRAPVWVFSKTNRRVRNSPKSNRRWRRSNIF